MALGQADIRWLAMGLQANLVYTIGIAQVIFIHSLLYRRTVYVTPSARLLVGFKDSGSIKTFGSAVANPGPR